MGNNIDELQDDFKTEIITISEDVIIQFFGFPFDCKISNCQMDGFKTKKIGNLNSFNRLKIFKDPFTNGEKPKELFTAALKFKNWDFLKYPNPVAYIHYKKPCKK